MLSFDLVQSHPKKCYHIFLREFEYWNILIYAYSIVKSYNWVNLSIVSFFSLWDCFQSLKHAEIHCFAEYFTVFWT